MSAIDDLAERCGIQAVSEDAFGKEHVTSDSTKRALLHAMGFAAETEEAAAQSREELDDRDWEAALPPVLVVPQDRSAVLPVTLPAGTPSVKWSITLEDGEELAGEADCNELPLIGSRILHAANLEKRALPLPAALPLGYHSLRLAHASSACILIVSPGTCWIAPEGRDRKLWGIAAQVYLLRSEQDWGMGSYSDLRTLADISKAQGADVVGVNPLHAMFPDQPEAASPYSPSDRLLLNVLSIDIEDIPELAHCAEAQALIASEAFQEQRRACHHAALVQYESVAALKMPLLRLLFSTFEQRKDPEREAAFTAFHAERRDLLDLACLFQALRAHFIETDAGMGDCKDWPEAYRSSASPEVQQFARQHADLVRFHLWMQWVADTQVRAAANACEGMAVGLYRDLAVGSAPYGAEVWSHPQAMVAGASVGAPPDIWNPAGQNWGLPPLHPKAARQQAYAAFIDLIRTNMRYSGALRIDHALALQRLYWIPKGMHPRDGAYVAYPMEDLIGILSLESHRNHCMVIGEDLGTVPKGFRERMTEANIFSYRVLFFERDEEAFVEPGAYPELSLSVASSHDLPTLKGWWEAADIDAKERLHLFPDAEGAKKAREQRAADKHALLAALHSQGIDFAEADLEADPDRFIDAAHRFLARTRSLLTLVQIDDLTGELEQVNIPATSEENPNWRRKLSMTLEQLASDPVLAGTAAMMKVGQARDGR
ncbi:MAG: 4-alpha-glucanotransferase [Janthinobacterium lividum]